MQSIIVADAYEISHASPTTQYDSSETILKISQFPLNPICEAMLLLYHAASAYWQAVGFDFVQLAQRPRNIAATMNHLLKIKFSSILRPPLQSPPTKCILVCDVNHALGFRFFVHGSCHQPLLLSVAMEKVSFSCFPFLSFNFSWRTRWATLNIRWELLMEDAKCSELFWIPRLQSEMKIKC